MQISRILSEIQDWALDRAENVDFIVNADYPCYSQIMEPFKNNNKGVKCMGIFFNKYIQYCKCIFSYHLFNNIFFSLASFIVRIHHIVHITYKICVS